MQTKESRAKLAAVLTLLLIVSLLVASAAQGAMPSRQEGDSVILEVSPSDRIVAIGNTFTVQIVLEAGAHEIIGAQLFLDFDPAYLQVVDLKDGSQLTDILLKSFDNVLGQINYAPARLFGPPPSGTFELLTIEFQATNLTIGTPLAFVRTRNLGGGMTMDMKIVSHGGTELPVITRDGRVIIANATPTPSPEPTCVGTCTPVWHRLRLLLILRSFWP